jgi:hypothetical protein
MKMRDACRQVATTAALVSMVTLAMGVGAGEVRAEGMTEVRSGPVTVCFGVESPIPDPLNPETIDIWHTDLDLPFAACRWAPLVSHDAPSSPPGGTPFSLDEALIYVNTNARFILPSIPPGFEFIGAEANQPFWILPQTQDPDVLYLGIAAETMSPADIADLALWNPGDPRGGADVENKWIRVALLDVRGPAGGEVSSWQASGGPPTVFMSTVEGGIDESDAFYLLAGGHNHLNWGFTQPGRYEVDLQLTSFIVPPRGDSNCNGTIDLFDHADFAECLAGPAAWPDPPLPADAWDCFNWFDFDRDEDVDLLDWAEMQVVLTR